MNNKKFIFQSTSDQPFNFLPWGQPYPSASEDYTSLLINTHSQDVQVEMFVDGETVAHGEINTPEMTEVQIFLPPTYSF